jgi:hypothetical protein
LRIFAPAKQKRRPVRLGVRTSDFHSGNRGSIPLRATRTEREWQRERSNRFILVLFLHPSDLLSHSDSPSDLLFPERADRKNYFITARGSVFECAAILDIPLDGQAINQQVFESSAQKADELSRIRYSMIRNLDTSK